VGIATHTLHDVEGVLGQSTSVCTKAGVQLSISVETTRDRQSMEALDDPVMMKLLSSLQQLVELCKGSFRSIQCSRAISNTLLASNIVS
jgi:hypothetical protein